MPHLEGVLTLVNDSGPWMRVQGRHVRDGKAVEVRVDVNPQSGVTVDVLVGRALWVRSGWYPAHGRCKMRQRDYPVGGLVHSCWARVLQPRTFDLGALVRQVFIPR